MTEDVVRKVKTLYLDLGVALGEAGFCVQPVKRGNGATIVERVKNAFKNREGQIINLYQMEQILGDVERRRISDAMGTLKNKRFLKKVGLGTYIYESKSKSTNAGGSDDKQA